MNRFLDSTYLLDELNILVFVVSSETTIEFANEKLCTFTGLSKEEIIGSPAWELPLWSYNRDLQNELTFAIGHVYSSEEPKRLELKMKNASGVTHEFDLYLKPILEDGIVRQILGVGYNISELVSSKIYLTRKERQIDAFFKNSLEGYFFFVLPEVAIIPEVIDTTFVNQIYEAQRLDTVSDKVFDYLSMEVPDSVAEFDILEALEIGEQDRIRLWQGMFEKGTATLKKEYLKRETGSRLILELRFVPMIFEGNRFEGNFCIVSNITQQFIYEKELNFLANKDPLTGLNNRRHFRRLAVELLDKGEDEYAVMMLDIDKFKNINDTYGHDIGDIAIRKVSELIEQTVAELGVVGRYGGEEFIVLVPMSHRGAYEILEEIRKKVENTSINYGSGTLKLTLSAGAHIIPDNSEESLDIGMSLADKALYEAKKTGRNRVVLYDEELHGQKAVDRLTGVYTRTAFLYKNRHFHDSLRKSDLTYGLVIIRMNTLLVNQMEILSQYVKQTAGILQGMLRDFDVVGRYDDMTFLVLVGNVNGKMVVNIEKRIEHAINRLSDKFDHLVDSNVSSTLIDDWSVTLESVYKEQHLDK